MKKFIDVQCEGDECRPIFSVKKEAIPPDQYVNFCTVDEDTHELPEGWLYYPKERKVRCPRCIKHKEGA